MSAQPSRESREVSIASLPLVKSNEVGPILTEKAVLAADHDLQIKGSDIPGRVRLQVNSIEESLDGRFDTIGDSDHLIISRNQLRGVLARAALAGSAQTAVDLGAVILDRDFSRIIEAVPDQIDE